MTLSSASSLSAGNTLESTIGPADVPRIWAQVWSSPFFSLNTTVLSSEAVADTMLASSEAGPFGSLILTMQVNATSFAVSGSPLENLRPGFILHVYSVGWVNEHDSAASGCGVLPPGGMVIRYW